MRFPHSHLDPSITKASLSAKTRRPIDDSDIYDCSSQNGDYHLHPIDCTQYIYCHNSRTADMPCEPCNDGDSDRCPEGYLNWDRTMIRAVCRTLFRVRLESWRSMWSCELVVRLLDFNCSLEVFALYESMSLNKFLLPSPHLTLLYASCRGRVELRRRILLPWCHIEKMQTTTAQRSINKNMPMTSAICSPRLSIISGGQSISVSQEKLIFLEMIRRSRSRYCLICVSIKVLP